MAKGKTGKTRAGKRKGLKPWEIGVIGVLVVALGAAGWSWLSSGTAEEEFQKLAAAGQGGLSAVRTVRGGGGHLQPGQPANYKDRMPVVGPHDPGVVDPGIYDTPQPARKLVHSLEHGMIVIYFDKPAADVKETIDSWAGMYRDIWSGVVVTPMPGLGEEIVLTAWQKKLSLKQFDPAPAAAFVDLYRGRGPEHRVR